MDQLKSHNLFKGKKNAYKANKTFETTSPTSNKQAKSTAGV